MSVKSWSEVEEEFLKEKWTLMEANEIAKLLGRTKDSVKSKIDKMVSRGQLARKGGAKYQGNINKTSESKGRNNIKKLNMIKESFNVKDDIKIKAKIGTRKAEIIEGKIIQKTDSLIVVKTTNYTTSFKYRDFYAKSCMII